MTTDKTDPLDYLADAAAEIRRLRDGVQTFESMLTRANKLKDEGDEEIRRLREELAAVKAAAEIKVANAEESADGQRRVVAGALRRLITAGAPLNGLIASVEWVLEQSRLCDEDRCRLVDEIATIRAAQHEAAVRVATEARNIVRRIHEANHDNLTSAAWNELEGLLHRTRTIAAAPQPEAKPAGEKCHLCGGMFPKGDHDGHGIGECVPCEPHHLQPSQPSAAPEREGDEVLRDIGNIGDALDLADPGTAYAIAHLIDVVSELCRRALAKDGKPVTEPATGGEAAPSGESGEDGVVEILGPHIELMEGKNFATMEWCAAVQVLCATLARAEIARREAAKGGK